MAKILMVNLPYAGHTNPTLPLTKHLVHRGHQVTYINAPEFQERIVATGATFVPYTNYPSGLSAQQKKMRCFQAAFNTAMEIGEGSDLLIYEMLFYLGKTISERLEIPCVRQFSQHAWSESSIQEGSFLRKLASDIIDLQVLNRKVAKSLGVAKKRLVNSVLYDQVDLNIVYLPKRFQPYAEEFGKSFLFFVPPLDYSPEKPARIFFHELKKPLIYISLGTIMSSKIFLKKCIRAFADQDVSVIMSTGKVKPETLGALPANIQAYSFVPQLEVLDHADLFITHGGMNSVNEAMYYGVPMLVIPLLNDQPVNARQVKSLNLGKRLGFLGLKAGDLRSEALDLLKNEEIASNSREMAKSVKEGLTLDQIVDQIEKII